MLSLPQPYHLKKYLILREQDSFAGGFIGYLAQTKNISFENLKNAVVHGSNMGSFCVEKFGTLRIENVGKEEIARRLDQFKSLTQFDIDIK